jgi:hypothetical protein
VKNLVAIDPGEKAGVAVFHEQRLVAVEFVVDAVGRGWCWKGPYGVPVVCEMPQKYVGSNIDMQTLLTLSFSAGYLVSSVQPSELKLVFPREWKGQRPKEVDNPFTLRILSDQERHILEVSGIAKSQQHNVVDAIGIGLWALGRR